MPLDGNITDHVLPGLPSKRTRLALYVGAICAIGIAAFAYLMNA